MVSRWEIENAILSHCYVHIQSVEGKTLPTDDIAFVEVRGIEDAAKAIAALVSEGGYKPLSEKQRNHLSREK